MLPCTTPSAAKNMMKVTPTAMIAPWPKLSRDMEVWLLTAYSLPVAQGAVETLQLHGLVAEILHRLVVDQAVEGLAVGPGVEPVHLVAEVHAPLGDGEGEADVDHHGAEGDQGEHRVVLGQQNDRHQAELHQHRQDAEDHVVEDGADRAGAPLQVAADGTGVALQVVAQRQPCRCSSTRVESRRMAR